MEQPRRTHGRMVEVDTLALFDELVTAGARDMAGWRVQDVDLRDRHDTLRALHPEGALLLGCDVLPDDEAWLRAHGALVFPDVPGVPVNLYRTSLYTPEELYEGLGEGYHRTLDARVYAWSRAGTGHGSREHRVGSAGGSAPLAQSLHDHSVHEALGSFVAGERVVGVMGGHALPRGSEGYAEAAALGRALTRSGVLVATGGGPGAMEAANLGARAADLERGDLAAVTRRLGAVPDFRPSVTRWARLAFAVLDELPGDHRTVGIPTWFYGHEPPGPFATHVAKFFRNALREALLLEVCTAGIAFLPGAAGTVQEVFQDACENYYADAATRTPMVLVGRRHWTDTLPVWPLLQRLADQRGFADRVALVDTVDEVVEAVAS
jgi:predicted Rossmann-fold nucleotide-binding protein